jgi:hypothetical protein
VPPRVTFDAPRSSDSEALFGWINNIETVRLNAPFPPIDKAGHEAWFNGFAAARGVSSARSSCCTSIRCIVRPSYRSASASRAIALFGASNAR